MKIRQRVLVAMVAVAFVPAIAACGGDSGLSGEEAKVADRLEGFMESMADGNMDEICGIILGPDNKPLSGELLDGCKSADISSGMSEEDKKEAKDAEVKKVTVEGDKATVMAKDISGVKDAKEGDKITMTKVDGQWYLSMDDLQALGNS